MKAVTTVWAMALGLGLAAGGCQSPPDSPPLSGSTCIDKMTAGIACGSPATNAIPPKCTDEAGLATPCPADLMLGAPGPDDCVIEYRLCRNQCDRLCPFIGPFCYTCIIQCANEYNLCKLGGL